MLLTFPKSILKVDVVVCLVLVAMEKLIEKDFNCPCNSKNEFFSGVTVGMSGLVVFCLTMIIQIRNFNQLLGKEKKERKKLKKKEKETEEEEETTRRNTGEEMGKRMFIAVFSSLISLFIWLTLWYSDGHYYVCRQSNWTGVWTEISSPKVMPYKWCVPGNDSQTQYEEQRMLSIMWFTDSQV